MKMDREDELQGIIDFQNEEIKLLKEKEQHYREIIDALLVPTNFIGIEAARNYICEAIETYGLGKIEGMRTAEG